MRGQGGRRFDCIFTGLIALLFALGCGTGIVALFAAAPLWRIADLFFDFALLALIFKRGPSLLKR